MFNMNSIGLQYSVEFKQTELNQVHIKKKYKYTVNQAFENLDGNKRPRAIIPRCVSSCFSCAE